MRIPHVTVSLFLVPTALSLVFVFVQLVVTGVVVRTAEVKPRAFGDRLKEQPRQDVRTLRGILYGSKEPRQKLIICRWHPDPSSSTGESPPSPECSPDRLDVAIQSDAPESLDVEMYRSWFDGEADRLHVCRTCDPDVVISFGPDGKPKTEARSIFGLGVLVLAVTKRDSMRIEHRAEYLQVIGDFQDTIGSMFMFIPEASGFVELSASNALIPFTANVVLVVMIAVWLALRAHRKVLEYFSQNGVLLPLVAATGKRPFYLAVWMLTGARVSCFLMGSLPMLYFGLQSISGKGVFESFRPDAGMLLVWAVALITTLGFLTAIASISDLKHRDSMFALLYRYLPFAVAVLGAFLWAGSFILASDSSTSFRLAVASTPILGLMPLLIAPILKLPAWVLALHGGASLVALLALLRANTTWFAAHLEEV